MYLPALALHVALALPPQSPAAAPSPPRPRVGLVLSGGGARGAAHVGVLRFLEEQHIPVDYVTGTSMGAIVGGLYSAGLAPDEIERVLSDTDWANLFDDDPPRERMSWRRKLDDRGLLVDLEIGVSSSGLELPSAVIQGQKISPLFRGMTLRALGSSDFDQLRLPYRAVAMDLVTGEPVVIAHGDLALAMRASMSIAGAFAPVEIDGRLLVDGGYVDNLPVGAARDLGAEIVIAVDVGTPPSGEREKLRSIFAISSQVQDVIVAAGRRAARASLHANDVLIEPVLGEISFVDFGRALEAVGLGHAAAEKQKGPLAPLAVDERAWNEFLAKQRAPAVAPPRLRSVKIENGSRMSTETLASLVTARSGAALDAGAVKDDLECLYGLGIFESVDFRVVQHEDGADLVYVVREKEWGPNYLRFGLGLNEDFQGRSSYELGLGLTVAPVNSYGAEWRTEFHIGSRFGIATEFYQPISHDLTWFVAPRAFTGRRQLDLDQPGISDAEYTIHEQGLGFDLGRNLGYWGEARVGVQLSSGDIAVNDGPAQPVEGSFNDSGLEARLAWDTLDDRDFPHHGLDGHVTGYLMREELGADQNEDRVHFAFSGYDTWGDVTGTAAIELGTSFGDELPLQEQFLLGGFGRLSGLAPNSLAGDDLALLRLGSYVGLGGSFLPTYAGVSLELGSVWFASDSLSSSSLVPSAAVFFGADTPLGPFILGAGVADEGRGSVFLQLGRLP